MVLFHGREAHSRSLAKAVSWRILGSIDTFLLSWLFTSSVKAAGAIALTEVLTKMALYYLHERAWSGIGWGMKPMSVSGDSLKGDSA
ncbi:DUF2061 domain-containing protein [Porphyrobacter sp. YT40]|uniref:DUF2061 domain-containing protein n=1 Tax=Porphyrobacter sp. YT40 TaxID=2547601 RepID=UPI00114471D6|nr:DUF2061 domain-containing protein [Porphyrobacter sp. YT40]QDH33845.1 DUF2061 domain-containing protein [Porphyrobacter sp. YT40]